MNRLPFIVTIDTEGDNLWGRPDPIETTNARYLGRFQELCERYALKPTYLVDYEMTTCPAFVDLGKDVLRRGTGEIGMHLHAWNSPPIRALTADDSRHHPYLIEYPTSAMAEKIAFMTDLLTATFGVRMISHRSGRWALNGDYARLLVEHGYLVDCSVTPFVSWRSRKGAPQGAGGSDYRYCPQQPYFVDLDDPRRPGASPMLEVPMSITPCGGLLGLWIERHVGERSLPRRALERAYPLTRWLRPNGRNRADLLWVLSEIRRRPGTHAEFMLHSSELMPGGSPTFRDEASIERLYDDLEALFAAAEGDFYGSTLSEFRNLWVERTTRSRPSRSPGLDEAPTARAEA